MTRPKTIRELDLLTYEQKLRHWAGQDPWKPKEGRYRFNNTKLEWFSVSHIDGNIRTTIPLIGRPCFGIITAYLRFRHATKWVQGRGKQPASRCGDHCPFFQDCARVIAWRIASSGKLRDAYSNWLESNGPVQMMNDDSFGCRMPSWRELCDAAYSAPFTNTNDDFLWIYYERQDAKKLVADQKRQRSKRDRARRAGAIDGGHLRDLENAQKRRAERLVAAVNEARINKLPKRLAMLPNESIRELLEVWLGRELLRARQERVTNAAIARWIIETGRKNASANFAALTTRVSKDLKRIKELEKLSWNGALLIAAFEPKTEFSSDLPP